MKHFGAFEAKTHFSELLVSVMNGEKIIITKHGVRVAMLIPFTEKKDEFDSVKDAIRDLKNLRKGITLGKNLSIKKMIAEGRK